MRDKILLTEINSSKLERVIINSIKKMRRLRINYDDTKGGKGKMQRYIFPVAYGLTKAGNKALRAFQTTGSTKRGVPKWKLFRLDRIYSYAIGKNSFKEYAQKLIDNGFNISGDKSMTTIFAISPLANSDVQVSTTTDTTYDGPSIKNDIAPKTSSQKKIKPKTRRFVSQKQQSDIDNNKEQSYLANKDIDITNTDNEPVTKQNITAQEPQQIEPEQPIQQTPIKNTNTDKEQTIDNGNNNLDDKPVTKDDVKQQFNDMMRRMDNVYNNAEEDDLK